MSRPSCGVSPFSPTVVFLSMMSRPDELPSDSCLSRRILDSFPNGRRRVLARNIECTTRQEMLRKTYHGKWLVVGDVELPRARRTRALRQSNLMNIQREVNIVRQKNRRKEYTPTIGAPGGGRGISSSESIMRRRNCESGSRRWLRCEGFLRLFDLALVGGMARVNMV